MDDGYLQRRRSMVETQLRRRGIADQGVLAVMERVPRHLFVGAVYLDQAYADHPLPIGQAQTISQPYMVARMTELCALQASDRVLEVGAGSGYQTAVLAQLCQHVYATELEQTLTHNAAEALASACVDNVTLECRDGSLGWEDHGPFDAILVAAGAPTVPGPLEEQLADGGRMVIPVGGRGLQVLECLTRRGDQIDRFQDTPCRFVNLRGELGWAS